MKKIFLLLSLLFVISCSKDEGDGVSLTPLGHRIETWKLISVKDAAGVEISNDCEILNEQLLLEVNPTAADESGYTREGIMANGECDIVSHYISSWYTSNTTMYVYIDGTHYRYDYSRTFENGTSYMSLTLEGYGNSIEFMTTPDQFRNCTYKLEGVEFIE